MEFAHNAIDTTLAILSVIAVVAVVLICVVWPSHATILINGKARKTLFGCAGCLPESRSCNL
jgi:hypothetical protein